jgi:segregation and condensation protein B
MNEPSAIVSVTGTPAIGMDSLKPIVEAALLAATHPLTIEQLGALFVEADRPSFEDFGRTLEALTADCEGRGIELKEVASGFRYQVRTQVHARISRLWTERQTRYTRATLETLALIAYRQPITRGEIEGIRGVSVSTQIIKSLEEREWIRVIGHREVPGRPALYGTTKTFLDYFNLKSLDELPTLAELRDLDTMAPELDFNGPPAAPLAALVAPPAAAPEAAGEAALETTGTADAADINALAATSEAAAEATDTDPETAGFTPDAAATATATAPAVATDTPAATAAEPFPESRGPDAANADDDVVLPP